MNLTELVTDWGGFERLVAALHETGDVTVEHNVQLVGKSGAPRQIDVLLKHKQGLYEHIVIVECKHWSSPIERLHVDALATTVKELGAARGVIFSTKGFQSGALTQAAHENIDLFLVRELTDEEWGLPGKVIDLFLHVNAMSLGNPQLINAFSFAGFEPKGQNLSIHIGNPQTDSNTSMQKIGDPEKTLEEYLSRVAYAAARSLYPSKAVTFHNGRHEGKLLLRGKVNVAPPLPIRLTINGGILMVPRIEFDVGIEINQSRITIDRSSNYFFALAVENCVRKTSVFATRKSKETTTTIESVPEPRSESVDDTVKNGSLISVWVKGFQLFEPFSKLEYGRWTESA